MNTRQTLEVSTLIAVAASAAATEVLYAQAHPDALRAPVRAVIFDFLALTFLAGIAGIVWLIVWLIGREKERRADALLDSAWNEVLKDQHYSERRHAEEEKRGIAKRKM